MPFLDAFAMFSLTSQSNKVSNPEIWMFVLVTDYYFDEFNTWTGLYFTFQWSFIVDDIQYPSVSSASTAKFKKYSNSSNFQAHTPRIQDNRKLQYHILFHFTMSTSLGQLKETKDKDSGSIFPFSSLTDSAIKPDNLQQHSVSHWVLGKL